MGKLAGEGGEGEGEGQGARLPGGALGGSMIYGIVVTMAIGIADSFCCHRKSKG
jgi:hypothetical protein